jgi:hypothetical protein
MAGIDAVFPGAVVRYQANVRNNRPAYSGAFESAVRSAIYNRAGAIGANVQSYNLSGGDGEYNLQVNLQSTQARGSINDIAGDMGSGLTSVPDLTLRGQAISFIGNPRTDGQKQTGTIPGPIQGDTYHSGDTALGTAGQFWFDQIGQQVQGAVKAISEGSPMMWLGIGVVALILFSRK